MLFNSREFLIFFALVFPAYLLTMRRLRLQNGLLLVASITFYAFWDWRFVGLLMLTSAVDFGAALGIGASSDARRRRALLVLSIGLNLLVLSVFKYANFFIGSAVDFARRIGLEAQAPLFTIALPVGISFYTFQAISYVIDVYRGAIQPCRDWLSYFLFIAYFPHLVAGPIQHPHVLLPQVLSQRQIRWAQVHAGLWLILFGYVQKVVMADNLAVIANRIFDDYREFVGLDLIIGALAFSFQIYCDFAGYSNIARGLSKLMGFELMENFRLPYFSASPSEFWRRWHISLSSWLRNYLYIPLGGNRGSWSRTMFNLMTTMVLGGLWHGASWNFVLWGAYHGALLIAFRGFRSDLSQTIPRGLRVIGTFCLIVYGWILFRSRSPEQIWHFTSELGLSTSNHTATFAATLVLCAAPLMAYELLQKRSSNQLVITRLRPVPLGLLYGVLLIGLLVFGVRESHEFIYFQF